MLLMPMMLMMVILLIMMIFKTHFQQISQEWRPYNTYFKPGSDIQGNRGQRLPPNSANEDAMETMEAIPYVLRNLRVS